MIFCINRNITLENNMYFIIYETTNTINNKKYIGKHITDDMADDYLGSGIHLGHAIQKYGRDNFSKKILFVYDNEYEMNQMEIEMVNEAIINDAMYYNIALGGQGGNIVLSVGHPLYEKTCKSISMAALNRSNEMSDIVKQLHKEKRVGMYGKSQSEHQKQKVSEVQTGRKKTVLEIQRQQESYRITLDDPNYIHPNKNRPKPKKHCLHCDRDISTGNFSRYHGENCKLNIEGKH